MKIITDTPFPLLKKVVEVFPFVGMATDKVVFTYGDDLYAPAGAVISPDVLMHEACHSLQQIEDKDKWWDRYLTDIPFRLAQEVQAYRTQYQFFCSFNKDRNVRSRFLVKIATDLASPIYGSVCDFSDAYKLIKNES